ncbi:MAG: hypothetical protein V4527_01790 [Pseudomonadota bacterium]
MDYKAWTLTVGDIFHVHICVNKGRYYTTFNHGTLPMKGTLRDAQKAAEREIIRRVREMLPAYRAIFARYEMEQDMANVTPLRPNKE